MDSSTRLYRSGLAVAILAAHGAVVLLASQVGPVVKRVAAAPVSVRFIEESQTEARWTPPPVNVPPLEVELNIPTVPQIELPIEAPASARQITARVSPVRSAVAAPPPVQATAGPKLISAVEYVREPIPRYPAQSRRLREEGVVVLRVLIDERGQACNIEIESSSGYARLDNAAKEAVARAAFRPYLEDGKPRPALVLIPIEFSLTGHRA